MSSPVQQSGLITRNHLASWVAPGVISDAGSSISPGVNALGMFSNGGLPLTIANTSLPGTPSGPYSQLGLGISQAAAYLNVQSFNGGTPLPFNFIINGQTALSIGAAGTISFGSITLNNLTLTNPLLPSSGGTGLSATPTNGQLPIGNGTGYALNTLTAGSNVTISNSAGSITISSTNPGGTVTQIVAGTGLSGGTITTSGTVAIANTGVSAGSYGSAAYVPTLAVNAQGQITSAGTTAISIPASAINTTIPNAGLTNSSITINGSTVALGGTTTVTAIAPNALTIASPLTGSSYNGSAAVTIGLGTTGTAGTYGSASSVPVITTDAYGRVSSVAPTAISIPASAINTTIPNSGLTNSSITINGSVVALGGTTSVGTVTQIVAGTGLSGGTITTSGTVAIANTSVTAASYTLASLTVNAQGQLTAASSATTTGSGAVVLATSPTLTTPVLGVATATSINGLSISTTTGTLSIANASTLSTAASVTHAGAFPVTMTATGTTSITLPTSGTVTALGNATTGSGNIVLATSPTLTTPVLGVATATSINGLLISTTTGTLSLANGSTLSTAASVTHAGAFPVTMTATGTTSITLPTSGTLATTSNTVASFSGGSTGLTPNTATTGAVTLGGTLAPAAGGLGSAAVPTSGQIPIGNGTTYTASTLTAGAGINIVNGAGSVTIVATGTAAANLTVGSSAITGGTSGRVLYDNAGTIGEYTITGTAGSVVLSNSPTLTTPVLGVATATSVNGLSISTTTGTLSLANGSTFATAGAFSTTLTATAATSLTLPTSGTVTALGNATTGSGNIVLATSPTLTTPALSAPTFSTSATVTAGTNAQGQGALTSDYNVVTTTAANPSGVTLPAATVGRVVWVFNRGTNPVNLYPASGATIDALAANAAISIPVNAWLELKASSTTQWYSSTLHSPTVYGTITFLAGP